MMTMLPMLMMVRPGVRANWVRTASDGDDGTDVVDDDGVDGDDADYDDDDADDGHTLDVACMSTLLLLLMC